MEIFKHNLYTSGIMTIAHSEINSTIPAQNSKNEWFDMLKKKVSKTEATERLQNAECPTVRKQTLIVYQKAVARAEWEEEQDL